MIMINVNNILSVCTINCDISSIPDIDNLSLCNIDTSRLDMDKFEKVVEGISADLAPFG